MDESRTYPTTARFDPPEEGMLPGERIMWTRRAGTGFWVIFFGFIVVMGGPLVFFLGFEEFGFMVAFPLLILTLAGTIAVIVSLVQTRRTRYYLTTDRILEVRGAKVIREIPLHHFAGKPLSQYLESGVTHRTNNRPVYQIRIYDPVSDEVMELTGLDGNSARAFERIGDVKECPYCNFDNPAMSSQCRNCDAIL